MTIGGGQTDAFAESVDRLASRLAPAGRLSALRRMSGGATQEIWRLDIDTGIGRESLILRRAPGGYRMSDATIPLELEAQLIEAAGAHGVPVPPVCHVLEPADGLGHGFVMKFVEGETLGGRIVKNADLAEARGTLARECGAALARIHAIDAAEFVGLRHATAADLLDQSCQAYRASDWPRPVFELAIRWLEQRCPEPTHPRLVHGDFRNGNLMVGSDGLRAVLDWEGAHLGDPMADLGWICVNSWRFGQEDRPVGGFGIREDLWAGYEEAGGSPVDRASALWWEVYGSLRWGCLCATMAAAFRGPDPSPERAVIARRTSETEIDLLRLIARRDAH